MPGLSRQQLIAWTAVGLVILLVGANYLRGQISSPGREQGAVALTTGLKEDRTSPNIKVHVTGAVALPGLYELGSGSRVADALEKAGGATAAADLNLINLAAKLADGQQVIVPEKGVGGNGTGGGSSAAVGATGQAGAGAGKPVNLNSATLEQIDTLDGIGPKTAQKIIDYREAHGGFKSIEELMEVSGIGPSKFEQLKTEVVI